MRMDSLNTKKFRPLLGSVQKKCRKSLLQSKSCRLKKDSMKSVDITYFLKLLEMNIVTKNVKKMFFIQPKNAYPI